MAASITASWLATCPPPWPGRRIFMRHSLQTPSGARPLAHGGGRRIWRRTGRERPLVQRVGARADSLASLLSSSFFSPPSESLPLSPFHYFTI
eukprot:scaffold197991_cov31-Tisochrysis_lutea.AAC.1